jgi:hypothetical protein
LQIFPLQSCSCHFAHVHWLPSSISKIQTPLWGH